MILSEKSATLGASSRAGFSGSCIASDRVSAGSVARPIGRVGEPAGGDLEPAAQTIDAGTIGSPAEKAARLAIVRPQPLDLASCRTHALLLACDRNILAHDIGNERGRVAHADLETAAEI